MKFNDIIDINEGRVYGEKETELINRGAKWKSATEFYINDPEGYEESKKAGIYQTIATTHWSKIPKTSDELIYYGKQYKNADKYRLTDVFSFKLSVNDDFVNQTLRSFWLNEQRKGLLGKFIDTSEKRYRMGDPTNISKSEPRFNYDRLKEVGLGYIYGRNQSIPANTIYCKKHERFFPEKDMDVFNHLSTKIGERSGCPNCRHDELSNLRKLEIELEDRTIENYWIPKFIKNSANRYPSDSDHKDELKYDYGKSWVEVKTFDEKNRTNRGYTFIHDIRCKIHDEMFAGKGISAKTHAAGHSGCPKCNGSESIGADRMNGILIKIYGSQLDVEKEKDFPGLVFQGGPLRFDRYVEKNGEKICFEFDGGQHFEHVRYFHADDEMNFFKSVAHDLTKNNYCKRNNIKLIRIGYRDSNNMEDEIKKALEDPSKMVLSSKYPQLGWNTPNMEKNDPYLYRYLKQFKVLDENQLKLMNLIK